MHKGAFSAFLLSALPGGPYRLLEIALKAFMRKLCSPILALFEGEDDTVYVYRPSHRKILVAVAVLFLILSSGSLAMTLSSGLTGGLIPAVFFGAAGLVCVIVAWLGSDQAVARIWKNR